MAWSSSSSRPAASSAAEQPADCRDAAARPCRPGRGLVAAHRRHGRRRARRYVSPRCSACWPRRGGGGGSEPARSSIRRAVSGSPWASAARPASVSPAAAAGITRRLGGQEVLSDVERRPAAPGDGVGRPAVQHGEPARRQASKDRRSGPTDGGASSNASSLVRWAAASRSPAADVAAGSSPATSATVAVDGEGPSTARASATRRAGGSRARIRRCTAAERSSETA